MTILTLSLGLSLKVRGRKVVKEDEHEIIVTRSKLEIMKANCISITLNISTLDSAEDLQVKYALFTDLQGHLTQDLEKLK